MPGIEISKALKSKINDAHTRENLEQLLKQKSAGKCHLCGEKFNFSSDTIHADHDQPESFEGQTSLDNLNLAHKECNKFKKNHPTLQIKKFLPFKTFLDSNPEANFSQASQKFFDFKSKEISIANLSDSHLSIHHSDGSIDEKLKILSEERPDGHVYQYVFAQVPISSIYNDNVQPRSLKYGHVFKIFSDLHINPLHEPCSVRLSDVLKEGSMKLLMFDGQHKAISKMLITNGKDSRVDVKIYLDLKREEAIHLVNSIQSKIIKLGLTRSEFAAKMGDEFRDLYESYSDYCKENSIEPSEDGFVKEGATPTARNRRKEALLLARINQFLELPTEEFKILQFVENKSTLKDSKLIIKETTFINKLLKNLLYYKPITSPIGQDEARSIERQNVKFLLNLFYKYCLDLDLEDDLNKLRFMNFKSQPSLILFAFLLKKYISWALMSTNEDMLFTEKPFDESLKSKIETAVRLFSEHPIWSLDEHTSGNINSKSFHQDMSLNKSLTKWADKIKLSLPYIAETEKLKGDEVI